MAKVTKKFLQESIKNEKAAAKSYTARARGKDGRFLKEIAKDERHHRKILTKKLGKLKKVHHRKK